MWEGDTNEISLLGLLLAALLFGPNVKALLSSGDATEDDRARAGSVKHYQEVHAFTHDSAEGFAFVAYPAEYAASGVMMFVMGPPEPSLRRISIRTPQRLPKP